VNYTRRLQAERLLAEVQRLWKVIQALPVSERPSSTHDRKRMSPRYVQLEGQIRWYAEQYKLATETNDEMLLARRVNPGDVETETPRRRCG